MSRKPKRKNVRRSDYVVVARGVHRRSPDISRLTQVTLDYYRTIADVTPSSRPPRPSEKEAAS